MDEVILTGLEVLQPLLESLFQAFDALARDAVLAVDAGDQHLVAVELVLDKLLLER